MEKYVRSILFNSKRTGSTFLQNCINSHPDIMGIDEVFVNVARKPGMKKSGFTPYLRSDFVIPKNYIENKIYKTYPDKHIIFKLLYTQIDYHNGLFQYIRKNKIPLILLKRRNLVKQVISFLTMDRTTHNPINITPEGLFNKVKQAKKDNEYWSNRLKEQIKLVLYYEDIIGETIDEMTYISPIANIAVCDFFGAKYQRLFSTTKKKNKDNISVYLPNIEDIKKRFENTEFEWMIK